MYLSFEGAAEGMEDSPEALSPRVGKRPQKRSGIQALGSFHALAECRWRLADGYVRWCGEDSTKLEVFVIGLLKAESSQ